MSFVSLFDKNKNFNILLAGILSLIIGVGVARFVFTSLLPYMLEDTISLTFAGLLASANFFGYLASSIFAIFIKDMQTKVKYFRIGIFVSILTTFILASTTNEMIWFISRIFAGFGASMSLVVGSAIVMNKLQIKNKTKAMGIHFSGIGFSIVISDLITKLVFANSGDWQDAWLVLAIFASVIAIYPLYILSYDKVKQSTNIEHKFNKSIFTPFIIFLLFAYFTEGVGFVIQATFLPDIVNSLDATNNYGSLTWLLVGISGIFSCILLMKLALRYGYVNIIILAMFIQIIGILIPTVTSNIMLILLSGILYGGTFVGLVALFMSLGGKLANNHPVILMGALTTAYGIGQVIAPLYAVYFTNIFGNYDITLYLTAFIVALGIFALLLAKRLKLKLVTL